VHREEALHKAGGDNVSHRHLGLRSDQSFKSSPANLFPMTFKTRLTVSSARILAIQPEF
jgi:hypothetical protein